ncbi:hypothetical protein [Patiriisocius marinus]
MIAATEINLSNKIIPESIKSETLKALSFYPELKDCEIEFVFKDNIKKSTMQAQPTFGSFFRNRKNRSYVIKISRKIQIDTEEMSIDDVPSEVMIGWLGHELGHVMDYRSRSNMGMLIFGAKYLFSKSHIQEVERSADTFAIKHGMGNYILKTKNFILDHADISETYKAKLRKLYMSPEEVMHMLEEYQ